MRNQYEYDDAEEGMQDAVERARRESDTAADGNPVAYDPADQPMPQESRDFTDNEAALGLTDEPPDDDIKADLKPEPAASAGHEAAPKPGPSPFADPKPEEEYAAALRKIRDRLSRPAPDYAKGYGDALKKDEGENRTNRILDYLSAGLRRAPTASLTPAATNAADFLRKQGMQQQGESGELSRLGSLARLAKPAAVKGGGKDAGNVESLRSYLAKVGAGTPDELAGMNERQLGAVMQAYGLKHRIDREPVEDERARVAHEDSLKHQRLIEGIALRGEGRLPAGEASKLGDADAAIKAIDALSADWDAKASAPGSGAMQFLPGSDANLYGPGLKTTTQVVGSFLEGGKLTDADVPKYAAMMPQAHDTKAQKEAKIAALKRLIGNKRQAEGQALSGSGYKVPFASKVRVSNGKETLLIDPSDVAEAERDGYRRVN